MVFPQEINSKPKLAPTIEEDPGYPGSQLVQRKDLTDLIGDDFYVCDDGDFGCYLFRKNKVTNMLTVCGAFRNYAPENHGNNPDDFNPDYRFIITEKALRGMFSFSFEGYRGSVYDAYEGKLNVMELSEFIADLSKLIEGNVTKKTMTKFKEERKERIALFSTSKILYSSTLLKVYEKKEGQESIVYKNGMKLFTMPGWMFHYNLVGDFSLKESSYLKSSLPKENKKDTCLTYEYMTYLKKLLLEAMESSDDLKIAIKENAKLLQDIDHPFAFRENLNTECVSELDSFEIFELARKLDLVSLV